MRCCDPAPLRCSQSLFSSLWLCLLLSLLLPSARLSAQQANGAVRGSVQDSDFFAPVAGFNIVFLVDVYC
jgi:hypothetical protein